MNGLSRLCAAVAVTALMSGAGAPTVAEQVPVAPVSGRVALAPGAAPAAQPRALNEFTVTGSVIGGIFYTRVQIELDDDRFVGEGGGAFTPGGGYVVGTLYADNIPDLVAHTRTFEVNATPVYVNITFFDEDHRPIGMVQAGAASTVLGIGGGRGRWAAS